jgi:chaperonin GroES
MGKSIMLQPTHDLVFLEKRMHEKRKGLIELLSNKSGQENIGVVVATGSGKTYSNGEVVPLTVQVGDEIIYSKHAGQTFRHEGKELIALREQDIYAIIERDDAPIAR